MARWPQKDKNGRKERVILGAPRRKLEQMPGNDGFVYRYFNDDGSRLNDAQAAGYEFVEKEQTQNNSEAGLEITSGIDSRESKVVGRKESGEPLMAYLMRKNEEMHKEDQAIKQGEIDEIEKAIYRDKVAAGTNLPAGAGYGTISIKNQRG